jgi:hypothetical protein
MATRLIHKNTVTNNKTERPLAGMTSETVFLNLKGVGGALTFAPTTAIDLYNNFNGGHFDARQFVIDEATNQSANLVGWTGGVLAGAFVIALGFTGAPVLFFVLIGGILTQATWISLGGNDWAGRQGEKLLNADWAEIDSRLICP